MPITPRATSMHVVHGRGNEVGVQVSVGDVSPDRVVETAAFEGGAIEINRLRQSLEGDDWITGGFFDVGMRSRFGGRDHRVDACRNRFTKIEQALRTTIV